MTAFERTTLSNGLRVLTATVPQVTVVILDRRRRVIILGVQVELADDFDVLFAERVAK